MEKSRVSGRTRASWFYVLAFPHSVVCPLLTTCVNTTRPSKG